MWKGGAWLDCDSSHSDSSSSLRSHPHSSPFRSHTDSSPSLCSHARPSPSLCSHTRPSPSLSSLCSLFSLTLFTLFSLLPHSLHSVLSSSISLPIRLGDSLDLVLIGAFHEDTQSLGDSLDLVPIGAFHGRGKRTAFLLAYYDPDTEEYQSICKTTFKSFSPSITASPNRRLWSLPPAEEYQSICKLTFRLSYLHYAFAPSITSASTGVFGAFLLACYDPDTEEYQSICKIGTGFSEAALEERSASLRKRVIDKPPPYYRYGETLGVEVWFEPSEVWEVRAADLSISPVHRAAAGHVNETKGIALRFPRFLRLRDDKSAEQATSSEQVAQMYNAQKINHVGSRTKDD
ncbi:unnamed protein product [Closterium sp. NIES-53]